MDGRVKREYVGGGGIGQLAALLDEAKRLRREEEAARQREERDRLKALTAPVAELCEVVEVIVRAHLVANGYRRYQGKWRRARERS